MEKKLAIIGANEAITMLIEKAKKLGYETHVFAWQCGDPGEKIADYFYPISISEKEKILDICKKIGICGICSITSDFAAPTVSYVARNLCLPCNPEITDIVARNKYEMRLAFKKAGLYCPKFIQVTEEISENMVSDFNFPVIVKPTDRWSSKGITRVDKYSDLNDAIKYAISESFNKKAIVEEFMSGPEFSAECIVINGNVNILTITQKMTTGYPHYIETGHIQPAEIDASIIGNIKNQIINAVKALSIYNSAAHVEFRIIDDQNIGLMEIGARMGGDCIGTDLTPLSTGYDFIKMVIDVSVGNEVSFEKSNHLKKVAISFIINEKDYNEYLFMKNNNRLIKYSIYDTDFDKNVVDSSSRHGYYIYEV